MFSPKSSAPLLSPKQSVSQRGEGRAGTASGMSDRTDSPPSDDGVIRCASERLSSDRGSRDRLGLPGKTSEAESFMSWAERRSELSSGSIQPGPSEVGSEVGSIITRTKTSPENGISGPKRRPNPTYSNSRSFLDMDAISHFRKQDSKLVSNNNFLTGLLSKKTDYIKIEEMEVFMDALRADIAESSQATTVELVQSEDRLQTQIEALKTKAADTENSTKEKIDAAAGELRQYADTCCSDSHNELSATIASLEDRMQGEVRGAQDTLQAAFAKELSALARRIDEDLGLLRSQLQSQADETAKSMKEQQDNHQISLSSTAELLQQQIATTREVLDAFRAKTAQESSSQRERLETLSDQHAETESRFVKRFEELQCDITKIAADCDDVRVTSQGLALDSVGALRNMHEIRLNDLEERLVAAQIMVSETASIPTRKVEWIIPNAFESVMLRSAGDLSSSRRWLSPMFQVAGASDLQLELDLLELGDGEDGCDCAISLIAHEHNLSLVCKLYVGDITTHCHITFDNDSQRFTRRLCAFSEEVSNTMGPVRIGVEVLEAIRTIATRSEILKAPDVGERSAAGEQAPADNIFNKDVKKQEYEGTLLVHQYVNHSMLDQVREQVDQMHSRMTRRVEWRLEQASQLRRCFAEGESLCSSMFMAAGLEGLQLVFYPSGYEGAKDGFCSLFLYCPGGSALRCLLSAGKQRREARVGFVEHPGFFGRTNFCRYDSCVDMTEDIVLLALEIEEAQQTTSQSLSHIAPATQATASPTPIPPPPRDLGAPKAAPRSLQSGTRSPPPLHTGHLPVPAKGALAPEGSVESVVRLQKMPGKANLEDVKQLPSIWTPLPVGNIGEVLEGFYKFSDMRPRKLISARRSPSTNNPFNSSSFSTSTEGPSRSEFRALQKYKAYAK